MAKSTICGCWSVHFSSNKETIQHFVLLYITYPICKTFSIEHSHFLFSHNFSSKALQKQREWKFHVKIPTLLLPWFLCKYGFKKFMAKCLIMLDILVVECLDIAMQCNWSLHSFIYYNKPHCYQIHFMPIKVPLSCKFNHTQGVYHPYVSSILLFTNVHTLHQAISCCSLPPRSKV